LREIGKKVKAISIEEVAAHKKKSSANYPLFNRKLRKKA